MPQLSMDEEGRVYGLEDVDFEIPYPSKDREEQRVFQEKVEALAKHAEDEPNRPIYMAEVLYDAPEAPLSYRNVGLIVGLIVGFQKPGLPTPLLYGNREIPMNPRPMTLRIEFSHRHTRAFVGKALMENLGFEVEYVEEMKVPEVPPRLVLVPIPCTPAVGVDVPPPTLHGVQVGKFFIRPFNGTEAGGIWVEHENGESMQCRPEVLEKLLEGFWDERF